MRFLPRSFAVATSVTLLAFAAASRPRRAAVRESLANSAAEIPLAITHVTIVNPHGPPQKDVTVIVSGGVIEWIGDAAGPRG